MRRTTTWLLSTLSALVLLFSYHTSTSSTSVASIAGAGDQANGSASGSAGTSESEPGSSSSSSSSSASGSTTSDGTYTGDAVDTRYGPVQVEITVQNGTITKSVVTQVPWSDRRDQEINAAAVPVLNDAAVQAQSAQIDMVSGATFTSEGYIQSLQSAIDQANL